MDGEESVVGTGGGTAKRSLLRRLATRSVPWGFPVCYLGWAYVWWLPVVVSGESVWSFPNVVFFVIGGSSPLLAGLTLLWLTQGREGFADLRRRLTDLERIDWRWGLAFVLFYPTFNLAVAAAAVAFGVTSSPLEFVSSQRLFDPVALALLVAVALVFPTIEEIGLRGYWFDRLQARWSALTSSLVLGAVWASWHVPLVYMAGYYEGTAFDPELWWWLPSIVATAVVGTWIYNNTRRSVLAVIGLHFLGNITGETMSFVPELYPLGTLATIVVAGAIVAVWGPESLRGWGRPRPTAN